MTFNHNSTGVSSGVSLIDKNRTRIWTTCIWVKRIKSKPKIELIYNCTHIKIINLNNRGVRYAGDTCDSDPYTILINCKCSSNSSNILFIHAVVHCLWTIWGRACCKRSFIGSYNVTMPHSKRHCGGLSVLDTFLPKNSKDWLLLWVQCNYGHKTGIWGEFTLYQEMVFGRFETAAVRASPIHAGGGRSALRFVQEGERFRNS